ncbi:hypothetical protein VTP01DRAFT_6611 [Rhizomucor pusillus]|uniref:uncharacterized protein n=1 Tax=Rhizomucor pusillus TaxID=4840 RepID=UPI003744640F
MKKPQVVLEPHCQQLVEESKRFTSTNFAIPAEIRKLEKARYLDDPRAQEGLPSVSEQEITISRPDGSKLELIIMRPPGTESQVLPPICFFHGGGWCLGSKITYRRPVYELVVRARAAVVFVDYSLAPEAPFPTAVHECLDAVVWLANEENAKSINVDPTKLVLLGDSAGGNLSTVISLYAKQRGMPDIVKGQVLVYPATDGSHESESFVEFAENYGLTADSAKHLWSLYVPDEKERRENIWSSPLRASVDQLNGMPRALVITAEGDVLREEGESYARKLLEAGNDVTAVRYLGIIHGVFNSPTLSPSVDGMLDHIAAWLQSTWKK